jgi:RNA polymerase sigma factor (sigma-70 family)
LKIALASNASFEEAKDAAGETMTYMYRRWGEIAEPRAYARTVVINAVAKAKKRDGQRLDRTIAGGHVTPEADDGRALTAWEGQEWVLQHLSALPRAQREVMACIFDQMSTTEIAATLGKPEPTVRKNLQWARERLKTELAKELARGEQQDPSSIEATTRREPGDQLRR